jgi:hypothetical protein
MELNDFDYESDLLDSSKADGDEELINLPDAWQFPDLGLVKSGHKSDQMAGRFPLNKEAQALQ